MIFITIDKQSGGGGAACVVLVLGERRGTFGQDCTSELFRMSLHFAVQP